MSTALYPRTSTRFWPSADRLRPLAALTLLLVGGACFGQSLYLTAKAQLAQVLLARAWARTQAGELEARPWPWADTHPVARLLAPDRGVDVYVLAGANGRTMAFGPGFLEGSARPGTAGNTIFAAHRDTHFAFLKDLRPGESLILETPDGAQHSYQVEAHHVRDHRELDLLRPEAQAVLTLITCYPFDAVVPGGPLRYVVRARLTNDPGSLLK